MLAALWERRQLTFASKLELQGDTAQVTREVDNGLETLSIDLPAVVTTDLRLNEPRYIKLPDIMKAKKKPMAVTDLAALGVNAVPQFRVVKTEPPVPRARGIMVDRKSTRLNSSHTVISYAVFCLTTKQRSSPFGGRLFSAMHIADTRRRAR